MFHRFSTEPSKRKQYRLIGILLAIVIAGGILSFVFRTGEKQPPKEEIVIVDLTAPPPPPPPPTETEEESADIAEADSPDDLGGDTSEEIDLGIDVGDLASGPGGGITVDIPKYGRRGAGGSDDAFGADMDSPPTPVNRMPPQYPSALLKKGIGGKAVVSCVIDAKGSIVSTKIKQSSGQPELDKAALQAVSRWKFRPAKRGGKPFQATCNIPFTFEVKR
jgi:periplasmic protein TonB